MLEAWSPNAPTIIAAAIDRLGIRGRIYTTYLSHWLLHVYGPTITVPWLWEYHASQAAFGEIWRAWPGNPDALEAFLDKYEVPTLILHTSELAVVDRFRRHGWAVVHVENSYMILLRDAPAGVPIYRWLRPWPPVIITPANATQIIEESEHALQSCPQASIEASFAHAAKINALVALCRVAEAQAAEAAVPPELLGP